MAEIAIFWALCKPLYRNSLFVLATECLQPILNIWRLTPTEHCFPMSSSAVYLHHTIDWCFSGAFWYDNYEKNTFYIWVASGIEKWIPVATSLVLQLFEICHVHQNNFHWKYLPPLKI